MSERIHLSPPDVGPAEEAAVTRALRSGWVAPLGPEVDAFEREIAERTGRRYAVALSSGTAALHLALLGWRVGAGDVVLTSTMTFAATANAIVYTGAAPVFLDCDSSGNIDAALVDQAIADQRRRGRRVAAIIPVDLLGKAAAYEVVVPLASDAGIPVLSDAAESLGARRGGREAGHFGDAAALSFNGNKVITTSGGGMLLTDDEAYAAHARYLASQAREPNLPYEHRTIGYNYRLSNVLAAMGRAQLARLDEMIERRRQHRQRYRATFADVPGVEIFGGDDDGADDDGATRDNFWLTAVLVEPEIAGWSAADLMHHLSAHDIESRPLWKPMHTQPAFVGAESYLTGASDRLFDRGLCLPSGSVLTPSDVARIDEAIAGFLRAYS